MSKRFRSLFKQLLPKSIAVKGWAAYCRLRARAARRDFAQAGTTPAYLGVEELHRLQNSYPPMTWDYLYTPNSLRQRGQERADILHRQLRKEWYHLHTFLDLGAWDGMACAALQAMGKQTIGLDIRSEGFSDEARQKQVAFLEMDAARIGLAANSIDCVFSFNSFEHFPDPTAVFQEIMRVLRPGGYIYLDFGPLFWSAKGAHQFKTINIPYVQCLFTEETLTQYGQIQNIELMGFFWMNGWSIEQYRSLWQSHITRLEVVHYYETLNADYVELISQYPTCFKDKSDNFDDFLVAYIEALFRKSQ